MHKKTTLIFFGIFSLLTINKSACAKPWFDTGDSSLRHQIQLLSDNGLFNTPLTTWPISSRDIGTKLKEEPSSTKNNTTLTPAIDAVSQRLSEEDYGARSQIKGQAVTKPLLIRDFSGKGRDKYSLTYDGEWSNPVVDIRLKASLAKKSTHPDDQKFRLDESYISANILDNWKFTVGRQSRWWGPGWDGSLILSNNARPFPSISLDRVESQPFKHSLLRWMGPWKLSLLAGQLESSRAVPDAKILGARFTFKPSSNFEVGLSRTAQWGGKNRPQSLSTIFDIIIGKDNFHSGDSGKATEPGNQLAGIDFRWKSPLGKNKPYAIYGQIIGEDESGYLPYKNIGMAGFETWGYSRRMKGSWRVYVEVSDTSTDFYQGESRNNTAYNHSIYQDGYRYQGNSLGHSIDSDSRIYGAGALLAQDNGNFWRLWIKKAELNKDGKGKNTIAPNGTDWKGIGINLEKHLNARSSINTGLQITSTKEVNHNTDTELGVLIGFTHEF